MLFPEYRPRRMRQTSALRKMIRETILSPSDFIFPLFAVEGKNIKNPIPSMPGQFQLSVENIASEAAKAYKLGIPGIILFGIPNKKDSLGKRVSVKRGKQ